jgi:hypothetical protein
VARLKHGFESPWATKLFLLAFFAPSLRTLWVAVYSSIPRIGVFLYMIDQVSKSLRPVTVLAGIGNRGQKVIETVYPRLIAGTENAPAGTAAGRAQTFAQP